MFCIIEQGGFQYKASQGEIIDVPLIDAEPGAELTLSKILLASEGETVKIGTPYVEGATATIKVIDHQKADKVLIIKKKRREDYKRKNGHRQKYTRVQLVSISV
jgi:large subunit ribosomal protein L21